MKKEFLIKIGMFLLTTNMLAQKPCAGTIKHIESFKSQYVAARNIDIWLPEGYAESKKYAVLYMHDGQMLFDSTTTWNKQDWGVDETMTTLLRENKIKDCIVVGIYNGDALRHFEYFPQKPFESLPVYKQDSISSAISSLTNSVEIQKIQSDNYLKFVVTELKPYIDNSYSTLSDAQNTFIAGSSMGGLISIYAICEYPQVFGGAACLSTHWPGLFSMDNNPIPETFYAYLRKSLPDPKTHKIYFDYGDQTLDALYPSLQIRVDVIMNSKGFNESNWSTKYFPGKDHSEKSWSERLYIPLTFLLKTYDPFQKNTTLSEKFEYLPLGSIKPSGWLKSQMQYDMNGFVGHLDKLVPDLINDPIYGAGRLQKHSKAKDLGNLKEGDAEGDEQYKWWNSETQSNWWDGYIRNAILLDDKVALEKVKTYIDQILATQDEDGYLGIYDKELRYKFTSENGEFWAKATLYRCLLGYYEYSSDPKVWSALVKAVDNVMTNYPINQSSPFNVGKEFSGGVAHGLTFTDILDRMYQLTGDEKYWNYALFLYKDFSENYSSEKDIQLANILDSTYKFQSHGVHTYEHLRPLIVATYASGNESLISALNIYLNRVKNCTTPSGGPIGDEWIAGRNADATHTGYEYCSIHELLDSYTVLMQKSGDPKFADEVEKIFYNAAQGSRDPNHSCIAYLKTDNSYEMMGTKNGEIEPNRKQTRYKYSPAHQDVAVCCNPNAGRISPYFIKSSWLKEGNNTFVASLLMPNILETTLGSSKVRIENQTNYPYSNKMLFKISSDSSKIFTIKIRKPNWAISITTNEKYVVEDGFIVINRRFSKEDKIALSFTTEVEINEELNKRHYFSYGGLVFAKSISATEHVGKQYSAGFLDITYSPTNIDQYEYIDKETPRYKDGKIFVVLKNKTTKKIEKVELVPIGKTVLRQTTF